MKRESLVKHWEVIQAYKNGSEIQWRLTDSDIWAPVVDVGYLEEFHQVRVKPEEPKVTLKPWTQGEVPIFNVLYRRKSTFDTAWCTVTATDRAGIKLYNNYVNYDKLAMEWEYSYDKGITWNPCGVRFSAAGCGGSRNQD